MEYIKYIFVDDKLSTLLLTETESGVNRIAFQRESFDVVMHKLSLRYALLNEETENLRLAKEEIVSYLRTGEPKFTFNVDTMLLTEIQKNIFTALQKNTPKGTTTTYGKLAETAGLQGAARAIGTALATNPLPLYFPCHRVIRSDGQLGEYLGGSDFKKTLLDLEGK